MKTAKQTSRKLSKIGLTAVRKKLPAAVLSALAALTIQAKADSSNVQIYGRANLDFEVIRVDGNAGRTDLPAGSTVVPNSTRNAVVDDSSRVGFRGREDLGSGLAAIWQIESRVHMDDGTAGFWGSRDSYVGLQQPSFGTLRLGRTIGPVYYATYDWISMHNYDTGTSADTLLAPTIFGNQGFMNNVVWYSSPRYSGMTETLTPTSGFGVDVVYSPGPTSPQFENPNGLPGAPTNTSKPYYFGIVGAYDQGPIHAALSYAQTKNTSLLAGAPTTPSFILNDDKAVTIGGSYDFKVAVVGALYERAESDVFTTGVGVESVKRNYWRLAVKVPVGPGDFNVNVGWTDHRLDAKLDDDGATQWTVAYNYWLSKRTKVYVFYTAVDNKQNGNYILPNYNFGEGFGQPAGVDYGSFAVGMAHNF